MSEAAITIDMTEWERFFSSVTKKLENPTKLLEAAFGIFGFKDIDDHFRQESGPSGPWPKRSTFTDMYYDLIAAGKRQPPKGTAAGAYSSSNKLLQLTGALRKSILPANITTKSKNSIVVFSNISSYSGIHDTGGGRIPQREFMWLSDNAKEKMGEYILAVLDAS